MTSWPRLRQHSQQHFRTRFRGLDMCRSSRSRTNWHRRCLIGISRRRAIRQRRKRRGSMVPTAHRQERNRNPSQSLERMSMTQGGLWLCLWTIGRLRDFLQVLLGKALQLSILLRRLSLPLVNSMLLPHSGNSHRMTTGQSAAHPLVVPSTRRKLCQIYLKFWRS